MGVPVDTHSAGVKRVKVLVPIPMDAAGVANRAQQLPPDFIAPNFRPEFAAVKWGAALGDSYHDMLLMDWTDGKFREAYVFMSGENPLV